MTEDTRQRFQGLCLLSTEGYLHMVDYDMMPPAVRKRLQESPFNLCAACVQNSSADYMLRNIDNMESKIRRQESQTKPE